MDATTNRFDHSPAQSPAALRAWLRDWVAGATGLPVAEITDDRPMESFGLSSRDAVVLSGELENLLGIRLDATIAYQYPTIAALTRRLTEGEPRRGRAGAAKSSPGASISNPADPGERDIAIVGMAARVPGAGDLDDMWQMLLEGRDGLGQPPVGRWSEYAGNPTMAAKMADTNLTGGYLEDIASFDAEFFGLSPLEATNMDPQQRIMLEVTWEALEDAGLPPSGLRGAPVGVFYGSSNNDYGMLVTSDPEEAHPYALTGTASSIIPNRVSYAFDFRGPSINVDTACSSSLVAIHQAVRALRDHDADLALAGGVNILASPFISTAFGELGVISPTGAIHAFSDDADGFVRSDAAGVLVLKRVTDARANGDRILAVIKGSAVNSDGHSNGLTAPNPEAQVDVLERAYADARIDPADVDYIEAHGTGTILGDPIEATALGEVLGAHRQAANPVLLGSAKSNFGHSESAAGATGMIKTVLALARDIVPPTAHFNLPNRYIDFDAEHLEVVEDAREWPEYSGRRVAGVSGFGFGGTNAHVVVTDYREEDYGADGAAAPASPAAQLAAPEAPEGAAAPEGTELPEGTAAPEGAAAPESTEAPEPPAPPVALLPVSGLLPSRRKDAAAALATWLDEHEQAGWPVDLVAVEATLARRNHGRSRAVVEAASTQEAVARLRKVAEGKTSPGIAVADAPAPVGPVFVYSGFGSQHRKMATQLFGMSPLFRQRIEQLDVLVRRESGWSMVELITDDGRTYDTETAQVTITAIQIALTDLLAAMGARPAAVMGMSMGEIAAAYAAGGISDRDAMIIACHRSRLMGEGEASLPEDQLGAMAVVEVDAQDLGEYPTIEPAVYTAPGMTTVGGPRADVAALVEELEGQGKFARLLNVKGAGHTSALDPILGELAAEISAVQPRPLRIPLLSSVDRGRTYQAGEVVHEPGYFVRCTRQPVWFQDATEAAFGAGHGTLVEVTPNPVALMGMMATAFAVGRSDAQLLYTLKRKVPADQSLRELLEKLYVAGAPIDFRALHGATYPRADVPGTAWRHSRYWTAARPATGGPTGLPGTRVTLPDARVAFTTDASFAPSALAVMEAAAHEVGLEPTIAVSKEHAALPASGELTTLVAQGLGGAHISVYAVGSSLTLVAEGFAPAQELRQPAQGSSLSDAAPLAAPTAPEAAQAASPEAGLNAAPDSVRWDPATETVEERLRAIVSESMGYDAQDLPLELPLIDLGLDSLMGMRIKNRVEHDFGIPPLQVQALRDGSVADVIAMVEDMVAGLEPADAEPTDTQPTAAESAPEQASEPAPSQGAGVAPRDASERLVFATWAALTGSAAAGVTSELASISEEQAQAIAERLSERANVDITAEQVAQARTLEPLADLVREGLETDVDGDIRVLRARPEGSTRPAVFMFHPAGGSSVVYQPLTRRLPEDVPVYGVERREGPLAQRAAAYLDAIRDTAAGHPIILGGWSFGGALAYEVAHQLTQAGDDSVKLIALLDTVQPAHPAPDTPEETRKRWERYAAFAEKTYGLDFPVPYELLESQGEEALLGMLTEFLTSPEAASQGVAAGVLEHQRASFVDNRILDRLDLRQWADVHIPVVLYRAERMHDGAIELEPAYQEINPDGGWGGIVEELDIVQLHGDHLGVVDEPEIATVGADLTQRIAALDAEGRK